MLTRRQFNIGSLALVFSGLASSGVGTIGLNARSSCLGYGALVRDPDGLIDLPEGFTYKVISQLDEKMSDGFCVPDNADGMGCFGLDSNRVVLVRNHELDVGYNSNICGANIVDLAYDKCSEGKPLPGGTTSIVYNVRTGKVEKQYLSLVGTLRNCSGGVTPWDSWLSCEESVEKAGKVLTKDHGYVFEVPAFSNCLNKAEPLRWMGRFNREAAVVDPSTGYVYMTEDRPDSLFYRFIPNEYGKLRQGGRLEVLALEHSPAFDTRNWESIKMRVGEWHKCTWLEIDDPESPNDDLRYRGKRLGAAVFARGEGIHWGHGELFFCCTNGGFHQFGQVMRYQPVHGQKPVEQHGKIQLFFESEDPSLYNFGDNLTVSPFNHLFICEDQYTQVVDNHIRGITPEGNVYDFAKLRMQTELAGACFSPDGTTLFVNCYSPARTLAIKGPWSEVSCEDIG